MKRIIWLLALALVSAGCSKEKDVDPPAELVDFAAQLDPARVWSAKTGGGDEVLRLGLRPLVADDRVYVAGHGGDVQALEPGTGRSLWRVKTDLDLSGGPASGEGIVVAGTAAGD